MVTKRKSADRPSTKPLLDKLGVKPGSKVAIFDLSDPGFVKLVRERTADVIMGKPRSKVDLVFMGADAAPDLRRLLEIKSWIEFDGAIWVVRPKGGRSPLRDTDLIDAGLAAGLVDNKIASFSETHGAMRFVYRLRDRPK